MSFSPEDWASSSHTCWTKKQLTQKRREKPTIKILQKRKRKIEERNIKKNDTNLAGFSFLCVVL